MEKKLTELDDRVEQLREHRRRTAQAIVADFDEKIDLSWIYHDNALEGVVLSYHELNSAINKRIISDVSLIPAYEEIKNQKVAIEWARATAAQSLKQPARKRKGTITVDTLKHIHALLTPEEKLKGNPYRKETPLHRLYFHEIATPDKIQARMKKFTEWLDEDETLEMHPVERAARAHFRLMAIFPWSKNSGKASRLLTNYLLLRDGYPPAVIHSIERQRYYDALRNETTGLVPLVLESLQNGVETEIRFFRELKEARRSARRAS
jgi:Fic family protein